MAPTKLHSGIRPRDPLLSNRGPMIFPLRFKFASFAVLFLTFAAVIFMAAPHLDQNGGGRAPFARSTQASRVGSGLDLPSLSRTFRRKPVSVSRTTPLRKVAGKCGAKVNAGAREFSSLYSIHDVQPVRSTHDSANRRYGHRRNRRDRTDRTLRTLRTEKLVVNAGGPMSMTGGMNRKVPSNEDIERRTQEATEMITKLYTQVVKGMEKLGLFNQTQDTNKVDAESIIEALKDGKDLMQIGAVRFQTTYEEDVGRVVESVIYEHLDSLDEFFLAVLNSYIYQIRQTTVDQTISMILALLREEILTQITQRLPVHMQLVQRLSEISDEDEWARVLGKSLGIDDTLLAKSQGWKDTSPSATTDKLQDLRNIAKETSKKASLDLFIEQEGLMETVDALGSDASSIQQQQHQQQQLLAEQHLEQAVRADRDYNIPECSSEELYLAVSQIIDDMESMALIPDFRFLIKLVLLREKIIDLDATMTLADPERANIAHLVATTKADIAEKVSVFLTTLTQLADERETQRVLYMTFRESDQATATIANDRDQEHKIQNIRPGEFMMAVASTLTDLSRQIGGSTNIQIIEHLAQEALKDDNLDDDDGNEQVRIEGGNEDRKALLMLSKLQSIRMDAMTVLRYILERSSRSPAEFYNGAIDADLPLTS